MTSSETKRCRNCGADFVVDSDDFTFYERIKVPLPTFCPWCRTQRRMVFWSEHNLFKKKDALTGKAIFSGYPEAAPIKIYDHDYWWSDKWDPMQYGREYDFSRPFFEQFRELMLAVPWPARENLDYSMCCRSSSNLFGCVGLKKKQYCILNNGTNGDVCANPAPGSLRRATRRTGRRFYIAINATRRK